MNDVVFVMANSKLGRKKKSAKPLEFNLEDLDSDDEWMMEAANHDEDEGNEGFDLENFEVNEAPSDEGNEGFDLDNFEGNEAPSEDEENQENLETSDNEVEGEPDFNINDLLN